MVPLGFGWFCYKRKYPNDFHSYSFRTKHDNMFCMVLICFARYYKSTAKVYLDGFVSNLLFTINFPKCCLKSTEKFIKINHLWFAIN